MTRGVGSDVPPSPAVLPRVVYQQNMVKHQKYKGTNIPDGGGGVHFLILPIFPKVPDYFAHVRSKSQEVESWIIDAHIWSWWWHARG